MIPAVIVCHGSLGEAYLQALRSIHGEVDTVSTVSNTGLSVEELQRVVAERLAEFDEQGIIFTDYFGGSCATACLAELSARPGFYLVSGVNLPILIYYLTHRREMEIEDLLRGILHRGQNSIRELSPPSL